jgi:hypothetical protein
LTADRKKPGMAFWATVVVVVVLVLYPLSLGPAARLAQEGLLDEEALSIIYSPLGMVVSACPEWVGTAFLYYLDFWGVRLDI